MKNNTDNTEQEQWAQWFRGSTPYISKHRSKTFVVLLTGEAIDHANITNIVHDLALLKVLGTRLVIVHGARPQIDARLPESIYADSKRITPPDDFQTILGVHGELRSKIEALFSTGLPNTPLHATNISIVTGNFVTAQPIGVVNGVDYLLTGSTRKIRTQRINALLDSDNILLLSPVGYSPSGQAFNLAAHELAATVAGALGADKLIAFDATAYIEGKNTQAATNLTSTELADLLDGSRAPAATQNAMQAMLTATRFGVERAHLISYAEDGALLGELFTAQGQGTQVTEQRGELIRPAQEGDVAGIVEIIRPLEEQNVLVRRSRDRLEKEIGQFLVAEVDGIVVGCCALYPFGDSMELACVAVHRAYRKAQPTAGEDADKQSLGHALLSAAEHQAATMGHNKLFVLTTQAQDWFMEAGYELADVKSLPASKQQLYNYQRNSKVMIKTLSR